MDNEVTIIQLKEALNRLVLESIHYRDTHRGEQFLTLAINDSIAVLAVLAEEKQ